MCVTFTKLLNNCPLENTKSAGELGKVSMLTPHFPWPLKSLLMICLSSEALWKCNEPHDQAQCWGFSCAISFYVWPERQQPVCLQSGAGYTLTCVCASACVCVRVLHMRLDHLFCAFPAVLVEAARSNLLYWRARNIFQLVTEPEQFSGIIHSLQCPLGICSVVSGGQEATDRFNIPVWASTICPPALSASIIYVTRIKHKELVFGGEFPFIFFKVLWCKSFVFSLCLE